MMDVAICDSPGRAGSRDVADVPLAGRVAAGMRDIFQVPSDDIFALPRQLVGEGTVFLLEVTGDSMIDAAITDGDLVIVREQSWLRAANSSQLWSTKSLRSSS